LRIFLALVFCALYQGLHAAALTGNPLKPPPAEALTEARLIIDRMTNAERGPYRRLRWFCADGTSHDPRPYACAERGGGKQYAEYSEDRQRLAEIGLHVGTIYSEMDIDALLNADLRWTRLRELPLEKFMIDTDDGWVLRRARHYRGRIQIEDEEVSGREILLKLLMSPDWVERNYLLLRELARVIPHGAKSDINQSVRRLAQEVAESETSFEQIRIAIHTAPSAEIIRQIERWLSVHQNSTQRDRAGLLLEQMRQLYGDSGRQIRLTNLAASLSTLPGFNAAYYAIGVIAGESSTERIGRLGRLLEMLRVTMAEEINPAQRLQLLDGMSDIESELRIAANEAIKDAGQSRRTNLLLVRGLIQANFGSGFLTPGERRAALDNIDVLLTSPEARVVDYQRLSLTLNLTAIWAIGSVRYTFAEALTRYIAVDQRSSGYIDDILRASPMLQLAELSRRILQDVQQLTGVEKLIGMKPASGMLALNPGIAVGPLRILSEQDLQGGARVDRAEIVVLPQTVSELSPVAGVMTMGEGNLLSHIQLLARNFGIPNVSITAKSLEQILPLDGRKVALIVGNDGSVVLAPFDQLDNSMQQLLTTDRAVTEKLDVPQPDLSQKQPIPISRLKKELSGILVGPKAANLGELNALFPGTVAPAIALPFGFFLENVNQNETSHWSRLAVFYADHRAGKINDQQLEESLAALKEAVTQVKLLPDHREALAAQMVRDFGDDGSYGIFLRSDTNVEDLPGFTGAGLSETLPNVVGLENQLAKVPVIWSSVLAPRAISWRSNLLNQPENVYPSVLLMKSVPSEKSGVLITADLLTRRNGIIASTAWGVGGAVSGEASESVLLLDDGSEVLISEAKSAYQRSLPQTGGVNWVPANDGAVLTRQEKNKLRSLAREVEKIYVPSIGADGKHMPWDIEFGFVGGDLKLFQIRPLVERGQAMANRVIQMFLPTTQAVPQTVNLNLAPVPQANQ
jgi:phosphoenolpyruvate synthase/pyruvate phosphate dikinase